MWILLGVKKLQVYYVNALYVYVTVILLRRFYNNEVQDAICYFQLRLFIVDWRKAKIHCRLYIPTFNLTHAWNRSEIWPLKLWPPSIFVKAGD